MGAIGLPCEISKREFDSKLLLASRLSGQYAKSVLVGYDKYFNYIAQKAEKMTLMDKSCSTIVYNSRIKPIKEKNGKVIVNDEEGFNNLHLINKSYRARMDEQAINEIDLYTCWGDADFNFFKYNERIRNRSVKLGNCRADLCRNIGIKIYENEINALKELYGDYILCSDNFCVEHWREDYNIPIFNKKKEDALETIKEYNDYEAKNKLNRMKFADMVKQAAKNMPGITFIIRPHPVAKPNWWHNEFWYLRNVHIVGTKNVEPWILGCKALVSMGCTTGLQALIANKPVIEIESSIKNEKGIGISEKYTMLKPNTQKDFEDILALSLRDELIHHRKNMQDFEKDWRNYNNETINIFADYINDLSVVSNNSDSNNQLAHWSLNFFKKNTLEVTAEKWEAQLYKKIKRKVNLACQHWRIEAPDIYKLSEGLYYLTPK